MSLIVRSPINKVTFGIDSLVPGERSKPVSFVGVESQRLLNSVVLPLKREWNGTEKKIVIDSVYTGDDPRILSIIEQGLKHTIGVNVIEVNGVMGTYTETRDKYIDFMNSVAQIFDLEPRFYPFLNQVYLYEPGQTDPEKTKVKFFQDHCADLDCGNCRKIHMRVVPSEEHVCAVPCFLQGQGNYLQLDKDGAIDMELFKNVLPKLSVSPTGGNYGRA